MAQTLIGVQKDINRLTNSVGTLGAAVDEHTHRSAASKPGSTFTTPSNAEAVHRTAGHQPATRRYAGTESSVKADADPDCTVCGGKGWHWGWLSLTRDPAMPRRACVDHRREIHS
jgi:hypothetical protein